MKQVKWPYGGNDLKIAQNGENIPKRGRVQIDPNNPKIENGPEL